MGAAEVLGAFDLAAGHYSAKGYVAMHAEDNLYYVPFCCSL